MALNIKNDAVERLAAEVAGRHLMAFLVDAGIETIPFGPGHWRAAYDAWLRYGKGRHPAALNFGDCMSYAVASLAGQPLLFVGRDFVLTDIEPAM